MNKVKIIEETFKAYFELVVNSEDKKECERFFKVALANVEREARHAAATEIFKVANNVQQKVHYENNNI